MRTLASILGFILVAGCAAPEQRRPGGDPRQYFSGYAGRGPVEPAEFTYDNPNASLRFPKSEGVVTFEQLEAESLDGGLDWPSVEAARMSDEDLGDYDPQRDFGLYGNEYGGGYGRGGGYRRPIRPPVHRPPPPEPEPAPLEQAPEKTPTPEGGPVDREKAKNAPERPDRGKDARQAPGGGRR
jgi:hypothetical protein